MNTSKEICLFLADYSSWLVGSGATCIRTKKNVERMSEAFGVETSLMIMLTNIHVAVTRKHSEESFSMLKKVNQRGISFNINTQLSKLSWDVADRKISFEEAVSLFHEITTTRPASPLWVLIMVSLANLSFCRLFGGDFISMGLVFVATLAGYRLKQILLSAHIDVRLTFFFSAFISSVIGAGAHLFGWGETPEIAIGTSVLYLIPGIPYINSVSDLMDGHYLCAFSRFMDAMMLTMCLSAGLCCGMLIMGLRWLY